MDTLVASLSRSSVTRSKADGRMSMSESTKKTCVVETNRSGTMSCCQNRVLKPASALGVMQACSPCGGCHCPLWQEAQRTHQRCRRSHLPSHCVWLLLPAMASSAACAAAAPLATAPAKPRCAWLPLPAMASGAARASAAGDLSKRPQLRRSRRPRRGRPLPGVARQHVLLAARRSRGIF